MLKTKIDEDVTMQKIAEDLQVYTGIAPQQYFIQLKTEKTKMLLGHPTKSVKELANQLNFESPFYFSKLFKEKVGLSHDQYKCKYITGS